MPILRFPSPIEARIHARKHPWPGNDIVAVIDHGDYYTLKAFTRSEWPAAGGYQAFFADHNIVAWDVFDRPQAPFEPFYG